ncbi:hypothetical protein CGGC5_v015145 [Colletotrichum fructicola Nara gc5]|uniref:Mg2+ transporter n=2 Tax=Colletotrichum fructicola (strain Nara gc5) TaxID=1213859 RepID=A0A7J6IL44_COLFN|nr:hypothetical protein CGGC5_v015145 [Colletotrichum fructicola Nara gc5]
MESLLSAHYGYDVGDARDKMQILSETQKWLGKDILQVARMKCLLIGADVLLTWAEVPLSTVCKDNIIIDESDLRPLVTVKITDFLDKEHCSYIKNDMSFAELIAYITNLTSFKDFDVFEDRYGGFNTILALYLPLEDEGAGFYAHIRNIINRFWGALDLTFRHIRYAALMNAAEGVQSWTIKGSCYGHAETPAAEICKACDGNTEYDLVGALEHLHAGRGQTQPPGHKIPPAPHEDPCVVWLQNVKEVETDPLFNTLMRDLSIFKQDLEKILDESEKLHLFVARPGFRPDRNLHDEVQDNRPSQGQERSGNQLEALALPTSLLRAFQNIVALLCVQARMVLLTCREDDIEIHRNSRANKGRTRYSRILETVMTSLGNAREDLILANTAGNTSSVRFSAVGAEYIVTTAMTNLQTGALRISAGSSKVPLNLSGLAGEPGQNAPTTATTELDLMAFYEAHARALDFNASIRPQRRAFLAIRALEEELRAIKDLNVTQWRCLDTTGLVLHPMSFPVVDQDRVARFALELKVIERAKAERKREHEDMLRMLHRAADLRARVKESIEVLDEGHGNAIRVFTLVTLFFLPLSFVTSFFGMNTVDIRDMPQSSWTYWTTAAPITLLVLCSAYLYAYKWEAIRRRVTRKTWLDADLSLIC